MVVTGFLLEPCNFLFTVLAFATASVSTPETAKAFTILVAKGFNGANAFLRSLVTLSKLVFLGFCSVKTC